jgi:hypothetical protein
MKLSALYKYCTLVLHKSPASPVFRNKSQGFSVIPCMWCSLVFSLLFNFKHMSMYDQILLRFFYMNIWRFPWGRILIEGMDTKKVLFQLKCRHFRLKRQPFRLKRRLLSHNLYKDLASGCYLKLVVVQESFVADANIYRLTPTPYDADNAIIGNNGFMKNLKYKSRDTLSL